MNDLRRSFIASLLVPVCLSHSAADAQTAPKATQPARPTAGRAGPVPLAVFADAIGGDETKALAAVARIAEHWHESSAALLIEMVYRVPSRRVLLRVLALIEKVSGIPFDGSIDPWYEWLWSAERPVHPDHAHFKTLLYAPIDAQLPNTSKAAPKRSSAWTKSAGVACGATASRR